MGERKLVDTAAARRELHELGKHRTEVIACIASAKAIVAGGVFSFRPRSPSDILRGYDNLRHYKAQF